MIISITDSAGTTPYNVTVEKAFTPVQAQTVEHLKTTNGQTHAYNRGATFDKFTSSFTIQGLKSDIFDLSKQLKKSINQVVITAESGELIFGAGIDYTNTITCNILNSGKIKYDQKNFRLAEIPLSVEALESNSLQLAFDGAVSAVLPDLNYQLPVVRLLNKREKVFSSASFGDYGSNIEVDETGEPINSFVFDLTFKQKTSETAQIEKYYNEQRSTPFVWPTLDCLDLFEGQATDNVMITKLSTKRDDVNHWTSKIRIVTNV
jgi:hypothetical protein